MEFRKSFERRLLHVRSKVLRKVIWRNIPPSLDDSIAQRECITARDGNEQDAVTGDNNQNSGNQTLDDARGVIYVRGRSKVMVDPWVVRYSMNRVGDFFPLFGLPQEMYSLTDGDNYKQQQVPRKEPNQVGSL